MMKSLHSIKKAKDMKEKFDKKT